MPDGDTGTNMALTLESVCDELDGAPATTWPPSCKAISHGSLMGARGNSGVILSQILRGLVPRCSARPTAPTGPTVAEALAAAVATPPTAR